MAPSWSAQPQTLHCCPCELPVSHHRTGVVSKPFESTQRTTPAYGSGGHWSGQRTLLIAYNLGGRLDDTFRRLTILPLTQEMSAFSRHRSFRCDPCKWLEQTSHSVSLTREHEQHAFSMNGTRIHSGVNPADVRTASQQLVVRRRHIDSNDEAAQQQQQQQQQQHHHQQQQEMKYSFQESWLPDEALDALEEDHDHPMRVQSPAGAAARAAAPAAAAAAAPPAAPAAPTGRPVRGRLAAAAAVAALPRPASPASDVVDVWLSDDDGGGGGGGGGGGDDDGGHTDSSSSSSGDDEKARPPRLEMSDSLVR